MANSFIQTPTDGSGKKLDTWTTTTAAQHRQAVVIGAKDTDANVAPVDATAGLKVDLGADNDVTITSGTITTVTNPVKINDGTDTLLIDTNGSAQVIIKDGSGNTVTFNANGQAVAASSAPVVQASDTSFAYSASATFTPAASSHTAGDVVGGAQQFSLGAPSGKHFMITDVTLEIDNSAAQSSAWTLYLYNVTPSSAIADDSPWDFASGDRGQFLGRVDIGQASDLVSTQWVEQHGVNKVIKLSGTSVFGYLVNTSTLTTVANAHIVTLLGVVV